METSMVESTVWNLGNEMAVVKVAMWALQRAVETVGTKVQTTGEMSVPSLAVCSEQDLAVRSANKSDK